MPKNSKTCVCVWWLSNAQGYGHCFRGASHLPAHHLTTLHMHVCYYGLTIRINSFPRTFSFTELLPVTFSFFKLRFNAMELWQHSNCFMKNRNLIWTELRLKNQTRTTYYNCRDMLDFVTSWNDFLGKITKNLFGKKRNVFEISCTLWFIFYLYIHFWSRS
jgi:hypothetical protein